MKNIMICFLVKKCMTMKEVIIKKIINEEYNDLFFSEKMYDNERSNYKENYK